MTAAPTRSSRGRTASRGKKKLPPIPERSLSSQNVRGSVGSVGSGSRGVAARTNNRSGKNDSSGGPKKSARVGAGGRDIVPPSPESRSTKKTKSTPPIQVAAVESRDDEDSSSLASPLSAVVEKEKKSGGAVEQVKELVISTLASPSSPTAAMAPEVAQAGTAVAKDETKASEQAEVPPVASNLPRSIAAPVHPQASHFSLVVSEEASVASVKSSASKVSGKVSVVSASVKSSVPKDDAGRSSAVVDSKARTISKEEATPAQPTIKSRAPSVVPENSQSSVKSNSNLSSPTIKDAMLGAGISAEGSSKPPGVKSSSRRPSPRSANGAMPAMEEFAHNLRSNVESSSETTSPRSVKSNSNKTPSTRSAKDKMPALGKRADGARKPPMPSMDKLSDSPTPYTSNLSRKRVVAVVGAACDDRHDRTDGQAEVGANKKYTPEPSWEDYQRARMSEANAKKEDPGPKDSADGEPYPEIQSIPTDEVMNSFMKKPGAKTKPKHDEYYFFDDNPNASDEEKMDISREVRDQYQLGRLQARIDRRGQSGFESSLPPPTSRYTRDTPSSRKTVRSSRIKTVRNLYTHPVQNVQQLQLPVPTTSTQTHQHQQQHQEKQPHDKQQEQQKKLQTVPSSRQEPNVPMSSGGSIHGSTHGSVDNAKSQHSIANNTSSTIPSLQPGQSINHSLTSSTMHSAGVSASRQSGGHSGARSPVSLHSGAHSRARSSVSHNSSARSPVSHHSGARSPASQISGTRSVISAAVQSTLQSMSHNSGTAHQISISSPELSEYRGKLFAKMLHLLHDLSPTKETLQEDDVSNIKDMVIDESRASCASIAELKLIQKLTEEEMSRILHEFEQNNSLVERRESTAYDAALEFKTSKGSRGETNGERDRPPAANMAHQRGKDDRSRSNNLRRMAAEDSESKEGSALFPMPEKIVYHDEVMTSIASKFSDVTSPTCHDGFELDEIMPGLAHRTPIMLPPLPRSATSSTSFNHKKRMPSSASSLPPTLSPAAAAAAATAASMSLSGREHPPPQYLPSLLEIPDTVGLNEENADEEEGEHNGGGKKGTGGISPAGDSEDDDARSPPELVEEAADNERETTEFPTALLRDGTTGEDRTASAEHPTGRDNDEIDEGYIKIKASEVLAASREKAILADSRRLAVLRARESDHHDDILCAAAKAGGGSNFRLQRGSSGQFDAELSEVTSILSRYEEAQKRPGEEEEDADKESAALKGTSDTPSTGDLGGNVPLLDNMNDLVANPKNVTFVEPLPILGPLPEVDNKPLCGICVIQ